MPFIRKRIHKENMSPLLHGTRVLVTVDTDKGQIGDVFFFTDLNCKVSQGLLPQGRP